MAQQFFLSLKKSFQDKFYQKYNLLGWLPTVARKLVQKHREIAHIIFPQATNILDPSHFSGVFPTLKWFGFSPERDHSRPNSWKELHLY